MPPTNRSTMTQDNTKTQDNFNPISKLHEDARSFMHSKNIFFDGAFYQTIDKENIYFEINDGNSTKKCWLKCSYPESRKGRQGFRITFGGFHPDLPDKLTETFWPDKDYHPTDEQAKENVKRDKERKREAELRAIELKKTDDEKASQLKGRYDKASATGLSPYFDKKGITPICVRYEIRGRETLALIPLKNIDGEIRALQEIYPTKRVLQQAKEPRDKNVIGKYSGCFFTFGELENGKKIHISEGYSTANSIFESTSEIALMAVSRTNLFNVAKAVREKCPDSEIIICGDDDIDKKLNQGRADAIVTAKAINQLMDKEEKYKGTHKCKVVFPVFPEDQERDENKKAYTDFNDLMLVSGKEEVKQQIEQKAYVPVDEKESMQKKSDDNLKVVEENIETSIQNELILSIKTPYNSAKFLIKNKFTHQGNRIAYFCGDGFWLWQKKYYEEVKSNKIRQTVYDFLSNAKTEGKKKNGPKNDLKESEIELISFDPTKSKVDNVIDSLKALCTSEKTPESGASWIENRNYPSTKNIIIFSNGILDFEKWILDKSIPLMPHTPLLLNPSYLPFDYKPQTKDPLNWIQFLNIIWKNDPQSIDTMQEWFGLCLSQDLKFHKILMLVGPPRSGKGTIARILSIILGPSNVVNPTLTSLSGAFGLQSWLNKSAAIISDARLSNKSDTGVIKERLLSISGEDPLTIERKHRESITTTLPARIMLLTNEMPHLEDASSAMASRYLVLSLTESFLGKEDLDLEIRLRSELPEILLWALQGLERLRKRKRFIQPDSSKQHIEELYAMTSPIKSFADDRCETGDTKWIETATLFKAWKSWSDDNGYDRTGTEQVFGRNLRALYPKIIVAQTQDASKKRIRIYKGIGLQVLPVP